jgi:hypothetical protein
LQLRSYPSLFKFTHKDAMKNGIGHGEIDPEIKTGKNGSEFNYRYKRQLRTTKEEKSGTN